MAAEPVSNTLKLADARERTPAPAGVGAFAEKLRLAAFDGVREADMTEIVAKQVAAAKGGDLKAAKFITDFFTGGGAPAVKVEKVVIREVPVKPRDVIATVPAQTDEPATPMVVPSLAVEQLRRLAAMYLVHHQKATGDELARLLGVAAGDLGAVLGADWFARQNHEWRLTAEGRREVG